MYIEELHVKQNTLRNWYLWMGALAHLVCSQVYSHNGQPTAQRSPLFSQHIVFRDSHIVVMASGHYPHDFHELIQSLFFQVN